jgi:hypothetical protein
MTSADITELLRASRPVAPDTLRERVREIASASPAPTRSSRFRLQLPRLRIVVPVAAATAVAAAALIAVVRPEHRQAVFSAATQSQQQRKEDAPQPLAGATDTMQNAHVRAAAPKATAGTNYGAATTAAPAPSAGGRAVDYEAQIGLEVKDNDALSNATKRAMAIARGLGGYVVSAQYATSDSGTAQLTLRVPSARVQDAIAQLTSLGTITSQQVQIQDLQEQLDALDRHVAVLHQRIAHVTALLTNPDLTAERRAQLEAQRAELQAALRRTHQQHAATAHQAAFATIQLALATKEQSGAPVAPSRLRRSLDETGRILTWEGVALLYTLVVVAPFALVGALVWYAGRARRRSEEARLLARS